MGRSVANLYGTHTLGLDGLSTLEIISHGYYSIEIQFLTRHIVSLQKFQWCFESSKGLVYATDLTMKVPTLMGYSTARIYLRDYIPYLEGLKRGTIIWNRKDLTDYVWNLANVSPIKAESPILG